MTGEFSSFHLNRHGQLTIRIELPNGRTQPITVFADTKLSWNGVPMSDTFSILRIVQAGIPNTIYVLATEHSLDLRT